MPRRDPFLENHHYHVYNRGLNKSTLFINNRDYQRFLYYLKTQMKDFDDSIGIIAYCLLPNHFHFVVLNKKTGLDLSDFMSKLTSSYAKYACTKYDIPRGKRLFEGRFNAKILDTEDYLSQCIHYVEFNSVKHKLVDDVKKWVFSSYDAKSQRGVNSEILELDWEFS